MVENTNRVGYLRSGSVLDAPELTALQRRMDEIMLGKVSHPALQFQVDTGGAYEELPDAVPRGTESPLAYRKVQGLESDPMFLDVIRRPVIREICGRHYGNHASISIFRAMMMNKPAGKGSTCRAQGRRRCLETGSRSDRTIGSRWIPPNRSNGCVQVIPQPRLGLLSRTQHAEPEAAGAIAPTRRSRTGGRSG